MDNLRFLFVFQLLIGACFVIDYMSWFDALDIVIIFSALSIFEALCYPERRMYGFKTSDIKKLWDESKPLVVVSFIQIFVIASVFVISGRPLQTEWAWLLFGASILSLMIVGYCMFVENKREGQS